MILPSIDLMNGKAVRLLQGEEQIIERDNVIELAKYYGRFGEIVITDIDAAKGTGNNESIIKEICKITNCIVGGGIRDIEKAQRLLAYGAKKLIISPAADDTFINKLPKNRIYIAIDVKDGKVLSLGRSRFVDSTPIDIIKRLTPYCLGFIYSLVDREGTLKGTDLEQLKEIRNATTKELIAAGGIHSLQEIITLQGMNISSLLGTCIYKGQVELEEAFCKCIDFEKRCGYIPTIVQDYDTKQVLSLAYSTPESLKQALKEGKGIYFSRSKKKIWIKGETSGNIQELVTARFNCSLDAVLFLVKQKGNSCHLGRYSCFGDKEFTIDELYRLFQERNKLMPDNSYTTKLFQDKFLLKQKIMEHAFKMLYQENNNDFSNEAANLIYHILTYMVEKNVSPQDILNSLSCKTE